MKTPIACWLVCVVLTVGRLSAAEQEAKLPGKMMATSSAAEPASDPADLLTLPWREAWTAPMSGDWRESWFLDGARGQVSLSEKGLELRAGPMETVDEGHTVLWTRGSFAGDLRIDFVYTRLDDAGPGKNSVNIIYFHAQGSGKAPYVRDIFEWRERRSVAAMRWYFEHMEAYHISFSAYAVATSTDQDYVRLRRYLPERGKGLADTEILPTYHAPELFRSGVPQAFTLIRRGARICLWVRDSESGRTRVFDWNASGTPLLDQGRIGLRHMAGRSARYERFVVSKLPPQSCK